jgi:hypothetical protein
MERVSIIEGKKPVIFVSPHIEDKNTAIIAQSAANFLQAYAVINNGWARANTYDYDKEYADCNNINHCLEDVVQDEFLVPIVRFKNRICKNRARAFVFIIRGVSNEVCAEDASLSMIVGYGAGASPRMTCMSWMKDLLIYQCNQYGWTTYAGVSANKYTAWNEQNLCQFFRVCQVDNRVHTMQLRIIYDLRNSKAKAQLCGECIAEFISEVTNYSSWTPPKNFDIRGI